MQPLPPSRLSFTPGPGRNLELKAKLNSLDQARAIAQRLATEVFGLQRQIDTYFQAPHGRLKLRETDVDAYLISYDRPEDSDTKDSQYILVAVPDPDALKGALSQALGVRGVVDKVREVYLFHNVRIHLDQVRGETFIEFEAVLGSADETLSRQRLAFLSEQFDVAAENLLAASYADMLGF